MRAGAGPLLVRAGLEWRMRAQQAIDGRQELAAGERLLERQIGAENDDRIQVIPTAAEVTPGYHDDLGVRQDAADGPDRFDAIRMRHEYIGDDKIGAKLVEQLDGFLPVAGLDHPMAGGLDDLPQRQLNMRIVIDDHDECHGWSVFLPCRCVIRRGQRRRRIDCCWREKTRADSDRGRGADTQRPAGQPAGTVRSALNSTIPASLQRPSTQPRERGW